MERADPDTARENRRATHQLSVPIYGPPVPPRPPAYGCFVAGTPVTMAAGSTKPIEEVQVGDLVLTFDEETRTTRVAPVEKVFVHENWRDKAPIVLVDGHLRATANHPFFVDGAWRHAEDLNVGDDLTHVSPEGVLSVSPARSLAILPGADTVYNIEVSTYHTYFADGVLVHNRKL